jgi:hypothetical protein
MRARRPWWGARLLPLAALAIGCQGVTLDDTSQLQVTASPTTFDFGAVEVGQASAPRGFSVVGQGTGASYDTIAGVIENCPDFTLAGFNQTFPAVVSRICETEPGFMFCYSDSELHFTGAFAPTGPGLRSCVITIDNANPVSVDRTITLMGTGTQINYEISLLQPTTGAIDFGQIVVAQTSTPSQVVVRNDGVMNLSITTALADPTGWYNVTSGPAAVSLAPGATQVWELVCRPSAAGTQTASRFQITSNDPDEPFLELALACTGIQSDLAISPAPITFPPALVGASSSIDVNLTNSGSAPLVLTAADATGPGISVTTGPGATTLGPGQSTTMLLGFSPSADGDVSGMLHVESNAGPRDVPIVGPGRVAGFSITPAGSHDLGPICAGQMAQQLFVAVNTGSGNFTVTSAEVDGGFALSNVSPPTLPTTLSAGGGSAASFMVSAAPAAEGPMSGTLRVATDIPGPGGNEFTVALAALGLPGGVNVTPLMLEAGAAPVGDGAGVHPITVSNCGAAALTVLATTIEGVDAADFEVVVAPPALTAPPGQDLTWQIELRPQTVGDKQAVFRITHDSGVLEVPLTGTGFTTDPPIDEGPTDERGSYYACQAAGGGGAGAGLLLGLALLIGRRRRQR